MNIVENEDESNVLKTYQCKSSIKTNTSFNRKLERKYYKKNTYTNKADNVFYTNHYTTKPINNKIYIEHLINNEDTRALTNKFNNKLNPSGINNTEFSNSTSALVKYCINCGNHGHTRGQCSEPNISNGVIAVRYNIQKKHYEYLIVMRKHSHGYCDIIRGKYTDSVVHIKQLLEETTIDERNYLLNHDFKDNWTYLWGAKNELLNKIKPSISLETKFTLFKDKYLKTLINEIQSNWVEPEWGFPKGQRDGMEKNIETAFREFSEESGYNKDKYVSISNIIPLQEIFIGSNNKKYKQLYYMALMNYEDTLGNIPYQENEIGNAVWCSITELMNKFRYYDEEKIKVALDVNNLLKTCLFTYI
jgi:8-oxo-dGTP pyrophosphatase MutT (NUDIX family)